MVKPYKFVYKRPVLKDLMKYGMIIGRWGKNFSQLIMQLWCYPTLRQLWVWKVIIKWLESVQLTSETKRSSFQRHFNMRYKVMWDILVSSIKGTFPMSLTEFNAYVVNLNYKALKKWWHAHFVFIFSTKLVSTRTGKWKSTSALLVNLNI